MSDFERNMSPTMTYITRFIDNLYALERSTRRRSFARENATNVNAIKNAMSEAAQILSREIPNPPELAQDCNKLWEKAYDIMLLRSRIPVDSKQDAEIANLAAKFFELNALKEFAKAPVSLFSLQLAFQNVHALILVDRFPLVFDAQKPAFKDYIPKLRLALDLATSGQGRNQAEAVQQTFQNLDSGLGLVLNQRLGGFVEGIRMLLERFFTSRKRMRELSELRFALNEIVGRLRAKCRDACYFEFLGMIEGFRDEILEIEETKLLQ